MRAPSQRLIPWRSITYVGRRGKPPTWLPRQKLAEERIRVARSISRSQGFTLENSSSNSKFPKFHIFSKKSVAIFNPPPQFVPHLFPTNELRLCMHLRMKGLLSGLSTRIKTNLHIFQKIQKTRPILCKIAMPFSAAYSPTEYYLQRECGAAR